jgi:hypothetical protein
MDRGRGTKNIYFDSVQWAGMAIISLAKVSYLVSSTKELTVGRFCIRITIVIVGMENVSTITYIWCGVQDRIEE